MIRIHSREALQTVAEALRPDAGGAEASARRSGAVDWLGVSALANDHYLGPALHAALAQAGRLGELPDDLRAYLALLHDCNGARNRRLRGQAETLVRAFDEAGVTPLLLKGGVALFAGDYPDAAARMIRDLDVMVPARRLNDALAALQALGYRAVSRYPQGHHAYGDFAQPGQPAAVDLHIEPIDAAYLLPASALWRDAGALGLPEGACLVPSPTHRLLHNLLHAQIHHRGNYYRGVIELRQLYDFTVLARRHGPAIDWDFIDRHLTEHQLDTPLQSYVLAAGRLFDLPWPLPSAPGRAARREAGRCLLQLRLPLLAMLGLPLANLWGAFARYRMEGLYAERGTLLDRRLHHAAQFLGKSTLRGVVDRLFKVQ
ncbi:Uncharacterised nucleotidyltransferase [Tistlia consotensis]|uniref:Uncharacterized nucleotidyltransferase n=1 Tax=Tistlia consotensis USBA 355 TaxID=560819 RepID=A0A1Y6CU45_9PROT|nr:nucleotidyltransferase family protein [Tistlia consotensis]SMF79514.1 Uncharacterised nucleotidyltransferase [Tistlia consotensis USBA 355]SNS17148.1 Uncharacterised nucleotidyltransferase [Tistlia consotensis]